MHTPKKKRRLYLVQVLFLLTETKCIHLFCKSLQKQAANQPLSTVGSMGTSWSLCCPTVTFVSPHLVIHESPSILLGRQVLVLPLTP